MTYATEAASIPTTWEQVRGYVDSLDGTASRSELSFGPWLITPTDAYVVTEMPYLADHVRPVSSGLAHTIMCADSISVYDVIELSDAEVQDYIRAVKAWHQDTERQAREVAAALILQAIYAQHHRPSASLPIDSSEWDES